MAKSPGFPLKSGKNSTKDSLTASRPNACSNDRITTPPTPEEAEEQINRILGVGNFTNRLNQETGIWEGPDADKLNEQARKPATGELSPGKKPSRGDVPTKEKKAPDLTQFE